MCGYELLTTPGRLAYYHVNTLPRVLASGVQGSMCSSTAS